MPINTASDNFLPPEATLDSEPIDFEQRVTGYENFTTALRAQISAGGQLSVDLNGRVAWSGRLIVISQGRSHTGIVGGFLGIWMPTSGTVLGAGGAAAQTATSAGILLGSWHSLYFVWQPGTDQRNISSASTSASSFRVVNYSEEFVVPPEWILLAQRNGDSGRIWFATGHYLAPGQTLTASNSLPTGSVSNSELVAMAAGTLKGNSLSQSVSPQDLTGAEATALLAEMVGATETEAGRRGLVPLPTIEDRSKLLTGSGWGMKLLTGSQSLGPFSIPSFSATSPQTVVIPGAEQGVNSLAFVSTEPLLPAGIILQNASVSGNTVSFRILNLLSVHTVVYARTYRVILFS